MSYEIAEKFNKKHYALIYPEMPDRPKREDFDSNASYGIALDKWEVARDKCKALRKEYDQHSHAVTEEFKQALGKEHGVAKHPKFNRLWEIAWEYGHSAGYNEVASHFEMLSELLRTE